MKIALKRTEYKIYHYVDGKEIIGAPSDIRGDLSDIRGDLSDIRGNLSGVTGDLSDCEISDIDRKNGIDILDLIENN